MPPQSRVYHGMSAHIQKCPGFMCCCCLQMRIDHKNGTVHFGKLQLESERLRDNISVLAQRLAKALTIINPAPSADKEEAKKKVLSPTSPQATSTVVTACQSTHQWLAFGNQAQCNLAFGRPLHQEGIYALQTVERNSSLSWGSREAFQVPQLCLYRWRNPLTLTT